jgi:hypothetical protein
MYCCASEELLPSWILYNKHRSDFLRNGRRKDRDFRGNKRYIKVAAHVEIGGLHSGFSVLETKPTMREELAPVDFHLRQLERKREK